MFNDVIPIGWDGNRERRAQQEQHGHATKRLAIRLSRSPSFFFRFSRKGAGPGGFALLRFDLPERAIVSVTVHDLSGRRVRVLNATVMEGGRHHAEWDGRDDRGRLLPGGIYVMSVEAANESGELYHASGKVTWEQ